VLFRKKLEGMNISITVAVMGCEVNGPGEASEADLGVAGGRGGKMLLFSRGEKVHTIESSDVKKIISAKKPPVPGSLSPIGGTRDRIISFFSIVLLVFIVMRLFSIWIAFWLIRGVSRILVEDHKNSRLSVEFFQYILKRRNIEPLPSCYFIAACLVKR